MSNILLHQHINQYFRKTFDEYLTSNKSTFSSWMFKYSIVRRSSVFVSFLHLVIKSWCCYCISNSHQYSYGSRFQLDILYKASSKFSAWLTSLFYSRHGLSLKRHGGNTVAPLKTPFRLLIRFIYNLQVVISITYYTVAYFHSLHSLHANLFTLSAVVFAYSVSLLLKHINNLQLFFTCELPVTVSYRELLCNADGLQDNSSARTAYKTVSLLLRYSRYSVARCLPVRCLAIHVTIL
jgi:hypothetical protein